MPFHLIHVTFTDSPYPREFIYHDHTPVKSIAIHLGKYAQEKDLKMDLIQFNPHPATHLTLESIDQAGCDGRLIS